MTEYKHLIEDARVAMLNQKHDIPTMSRNQQDDFWIYTYQSGKIVHSYVDNRKKDLVISEGEL